MVVRREDRAGICCWGEDEAAAAGESGEGAVRVKRIDQDEAVLLVCAKER